MSTRIGITFNLDWIAAFLCEWFRISRVRHVKHKTNEVSLRDDKIWRFLRRVRSGHKQPDVQAPYHRCSLTFHLRGLLYHRILELAWKTSRYADIRFSPSVSKWTISTFHIQSIQFNWEHMHSALWHIFEMRCLSIICILWSLCAVFFNTRSSVSLNGNLRALAYANDEDFFLGLIGKPEQKSNGTH